MSSPVPATFAAALFDGPGRPLRLVELPRPHPGPGEALVRITCCTLCGSDFHTWRGRRTAPAPSILGHEAVGVIEETGAGPVTDFTGRELAAGDRVSWSLAVSCGACRLCRRGLPQKCETLFKYGHARCAPGDSPSGGLAALTVLRAGTAIFRLPEGVPDPVAATANCAAATVAGLLRSIGFAPGESLLIQGAGMLGLVAAAMARESGAGVIYVADPDAARARQALAFGATAAGPAPEAAAGARGFDAALELSGSPAAVEAALPLLGIGARYGLAGAVFPSRPAALDCELLVRRMIHLQGVHNYAPADLETALAFLAGAGTRYPFASLIARAFPLTEVNDALAWAEIHRPARVAVIPGLATP